MWYSWAQMSNLSYSLHLPLLYEEDEKYDDGDCHNVGPIVVEEMGAVTWRVEAIVVVTGYGGDGINCEEDAIDNKKSNN